MQCTEIHDSKYLRVLWGGESRIIGIDWKESTDGMTDEDFKAELTMFAGLVEQRAARGILVDVSRFRHAMRPGPQEWRVKNISGRYFAAGVRRFAFLFPADASIPPAMNASSPGESFVTRAFNDSEKAMTWLSEPD
ncbi:MAG TPA: hypothetical protein VKE70_14695 [Candidatus Solibacter sp.]|nr:hypothetical protein [Candidatus Solibacter sp.]